MHDSTKVKLIPENASIASVKIIHPASETALQDVVFQYKISPDSKGVTFFLGEESQPKLIKSFALDDQYGIALEVEVANYLVTNGIELDFGSGNADTEKLLKANCRIIGLCFMPIMRFLKQH
jgi:hypothetical protein